MIATGIVHAHSTYSYDGKESLLSLKEFLLSKGVSFCCLTEHTDHMTVEQAQMFVQECKSLSGSQFVFIPGFEVPYAFLGSRKSAHVLLIGTEVFLGQTVDAQTLKSWSSKSALTVLAHPVRNSFVMDSVLEEVIDGIEIWNQQYDGKLAPRVRSLRLFNTFLKKKPELMAFGGTDFHRREHFGAPLYTIEIPVLSLSAILQTFTEKTYSFGHRKIQVAPSGFWKGSGSLHSSFKSALSIFVIAVGKFLGALFARLGFTFPKNIKRFIRSKV